MDHVLKSARGAIGAAALVLVACSSSSSSNAPADASADAAEEPFNPKSSCGHPGDMGNSLGVGKFCQYTIADCGMNLKARLCTTLDPKGNDNYFCTFPCHPTDPPDVCGENARCACDPGSGDACGCFPTACDGPRPDGGADANDGAADAPADSPSEAARD